MANRFNSFKKGISKVKNISSKIKRNSNYGKSKNKKSKNAKSGIEYIVPENSPLRKSSDLEGYGEYYDSDYLDDFSGAEGYVRSASDYLDDFSDEYAHLRSDSNGFDNSSSRLGVSKDLVSDDLDEIDKKYAKYIFGDDFGDENYEISEGSCGKVFGDINALMGNIVHNRKTGKNYDDFDENYSKNIFKNLDNDLDNNDKYEDNSYSDENYSNFYDYGLENEFNEKTDLDNLENGNLKLQSKAIKTKLLSFKRNLLSKDDNSKNSFGKVVFILIFLVLASSLFYFFIYQPFQDELNLERTAKLNELNTFYSGPLEAHENAYTLKSQIESENDINELKLIDILIYATKDWRNYHKSKIVTSKDNFGRVMLVYGDENKNIIMSVKDANDFVKDNDANVLSKVRFEKVDTTIVPISISRLQATAGLISVGSIVDIYSLNDNYSSSWDDSSDSDMGSSQPINGSNFEDSSENSAGASDSESDSLNNSNNSESSTNLDDSSDDGDYTSSMGGEALEEISQFTSSDEPDVSGATVLAILRSKDGGVIDSSISESNTFIKGNITAPYENTSSYSNDVEELLKASVFNSYNDNKVLESYLDGYGIKLSNYERMSNLADLDSEYLVLLEVPRSDVSFVINNMDNLILTIPTEFAPNWVIGELNETYYENKYGYDLNSPYLLG